MKHFIHAGFVRREKKGRDWLIPLNWVKVVTRRINRRKAKQSLMSLVNDMAS